MKNRIVHMALVCASLVSISIVGWAQPFPQSPSALAGAQIPMSRAIKTFHSMVLGNNRGTASPMAQQMRMALNLDDARFSALLSHMQKAWDESNAHGRTLRSSMCSSPAAFTTLESLSSELERIDQEEEVHLVRLFQGVDSVIGADAKLKLDAFIIQTRNGTAIRSTNYLQGMRDRNEDIATARARFCR